MMYSPDHPHSHEGRGNAFAIATALNCAIVAVQLLSGTLAHSTALLADAIHNAGDVIGLFLAWGAYALSSRPATPRFTYGLSAGTILAALVNAMLLVGATGMIAWESLRRLFEPMPVASEIVIAAALLAIAGNAFSAWLLSPGGRDMNVKGAFWHLVSDALVSAGVVVAAMTVSLTGALWVDPLAGLAIAFVILWSTRGLLREAVNLSFHAIPSSIDIAGVNSYLASVPGLVRIHDLHIWPLSTTETALTCHFVVDGSFDAHALSRVGRELESRFAIGHATIQLENEGGEPCRLSVGGH